MGTGTITLWWYALCCAFVTVSVIVTSVLVALGQRKRARRLAERARRARPTDEPAGPTGTDADDLERDDE